ncbi:MAG: phosphoribosylanthranilate isomerase [Bacteroidaceae bacterium]|nr:phosphoribosylanthranilate isomerase [Bacteroidaceae bacterium]
MIVKVCGMRDAENIRQVDVIEGVDWMGFIFFPRSPRHVSEIPTYLPQHCKRVGVFVNAPVEDIASRVQTFGFQLVQLHGHETPEFILSLRAAISNEVKIIKMIQIASLEDLDKAMQYEGIVDYFLFETKCDTYGGCGKQFNWSILQNYHGTTPFLITGGIKPSDAEKVKAFHHPQFIGIDLNSGFETAPALKDPALLHDFLEIVKSSNFLK